MTESDPESSAPDRRGFFRLAGAAAAGAAVGAIAGAAGGYAAGSHTDQLPYSTLPPRAEGAGFDHLVVVMFENRSFDNLLGYLYSETGTPVPHGQAFEGLDGHDLSNSAPDGSVIPAHVYDGATDEVMHSPDPDPGEEYPYVNTQLFGVVDPADNSKHEIDSLRAPYNSPSHRRTPTMSGFVLDYIDKWRSEHHGKAPTVEEYSVIMGSFAPEMLPVFSTLAQNFVVYDHWHCAVPSQTFPNRSFFHASTSHGFVTNEANGGAEKWLRSHPTKEPTIFNRLEKAGVSWRVYFDDRQLISLTGLLHAPQLEPFWKTRFGTMSEFFVDAATGTLPAYSFIEPRLLYDHNDMHPPVGPMTRLDLDGTIIEGGAISDVRAGDALLHAIYTAIRTSASPQGSHALNTALMVTFDEHGGTYDHVPPPSATPPGDGAKGEMDFDFSRLGVRVPTLVVSAYTPASIVNDEMHHGSLVSSLCARWGLDPITARDAGAPTIDNAFTLKTPRDPATWPTTAPHYVPKNPESTEVIRPGDEDRPLSPPGIGLMSMLIAKYAPTEPKPRTYREAWDLVHRHGMGLFGPG